MSLKNKNQFSEYCQCYIDGNRSQKCKRRCNETERGNRKKLNYSGTFIILIHREDEAIKIKKKHIPSQMSQYICICFTPLT